MLKEQLRNRKIDYADISQTDQQNNPEPHHIEGRAIGARGDLLSIMSDHLPEYDMTGGADNT